MNINGSYLLILKWFVFFLVNRVAIQRTHAFYVFEIAEQDKTIGYRKSGQLERKYVWAIKISQMCHWLIGKI